MPHALREKVPTALGEDPEGRMTDGGSSPPASMESRTNGRGRAPRHALVQHYLPLLGKGHNGDFTLKLGEDSTILGVHEVEVFDPAGGNKQRTWRLSMLVLEDMKSRVVPWHFIVKGVGERVELPTAWNCVAAVQSRSGYLWTVFQVWPD